MCKKRNINYTNKEIKCIILFTYLYKAHCPVSREEKLYGAIFNNEVFAYDQMLEVFRLTPQIMVINTKTNSVADLQRTGDK
jgi:hypothetical protein